MAATKKPASKKPATPVWKKKRPKNVKKTTLTAEQKQEAKTRAAKAGRPYPNLVDNMAVAKKARHSSPKKKSSPEQS